MGFLLVGPFILPLVWINPNMSKTRKLAWTVVLSILSYFLVIWTMDSIKKLEEYQRDHSPRLQKEHADKYANKFVAFRTLLEVV